MFDFAEEVSHCLPRLRAPEPQRTGTLVRLVGLTLETRGIMAPLGACCEVVGRHVLCRNYRVGPKSLCLRL